MTNKTKIVLVTGGSRGLGRDMALSMARRGIDIIITYHSNDKEANNVVEEIKGMGQKAAAFQLDVAKHASFKAFAEQVAQHLKDDGRDGNIDALVNNAGVGEYARISETTEAALDNMYAIHLKAPYLLTQQLLPMINEGGAVVNISSGLARFSYDGYAPYAIMKGGVETLTRYMAKEFGPKKIRVNTVAPGAIETDFHGGMVRDNKQLNAMIAGQTALGRVGLPDDIGSVVAFLCSDDAKWINAQRIEVSGGIHI